MKAITKILKNGDEVLWVQPDNLAESRAIAKVGSQFETDVQDDKDGKAYHTTAFKIIECGDFKIELIEEYKCENAEELRRREGELIKQLNCVNKQIAGRGVKQYAKDNAKTIKEYQDQYTNKMQSIFSIDNKEKIKLQRKAYREKNNEKKRERD